MDLLLRSYFCDRSWIDVGLFFCCDWFVFSLFVLLDFCPDSSRSRYIATTIGLKLVRTTHVLVCVCLCVWCVCVCVCTSIQFLSLKSQLVCVVP